MRTLLSMFLILAIVGTVAVVIRIVVLALEMLFGILCLAALLKLVSR